MIAVEFVNAARSSAVLISGVPATLPRTPSKTLGASRPYAEGCDGTFVDKAIALINIIPTTNTIPACRPVVIHHSHLSAPRRRNRSRCKTIRRDFAAAWTSCVVIVGEGFLIII